MLNRSRLLGLLLAALAVLLVAVVGVAVAVLPPGGTFVDDDGNIHEGNIEAIAAEGITKGCNPPTNDRYCPSSSLTRGQMAAFVRRALSLPASATDYFSDDNGSVFEGDINAIAEAGITKGCNPPANDRFCPDGSITREQMAAFLRRAFEYPAAPTDYFVDDNASIFESDINAIALAGVTLGCNPPTNNRYCPKDLVKRDQMASFFSRALDLTPIYPPGSTTTTTGPATTTTLPPSVCAAQSAVPRSECDALEALYASTNGGAWTTRTGWMSDLNLCNWFGVTCAAGTITELSLQYNSLNGSLPSELGDLTNLTNLRLGNNQLAGSIPSTIGDLANLSSLDIGANTLSGAIPSSVGNLTDLNDLWLYDNSLTGTIPSTIGNLTSLGDLELHGNGFTGPIPAGIGSLTNLYWLGLNDNALSGEVPGALTDLVALTRFQLNGQTGCLTASDPELEDWLNGYDPLWDDGCA